MEFIASNFVPLMFAGLIFVTSVISDRPSADRICAPSPYCRSVWGGLVVPVQTQGSDRGWFSCWRARWR